MNKRKTMQERLTILGWNKLFRNSVGIVLFFGLSIVIFFVIWLEVKLGLISNLWSLYF